MSVMVDQPYHGVSDLFPQLLCIRRPQKHVWKGQMSTKTEEIQLPNMRSQRGFLVSARVNFLLHVLLS